MDLEPLGANLPRTFARYISYIRRLNGLNCINARGHKVLKDPVIPSRIGIPVIWDRRLTSLDASPACSYVCLFV